MRVISPVKEDQVPGVRPNDGAGPIDLGDPLCLGVMCEQQLTTGIVVGAEEQAS